MFCHSNKKYLHDYHPFPSDFSFSFPFLPLSLSFLQTVMCMYVPTSLWAWRQPVISALDSRPGVLGCNTTKGRSQCLPPFAGYPQRKLLLWPDKVWRGGRVWWVDCHGSFPSWGTSLFPNLKPGYDQGVSANPQLYEMAFCILSLYVLSLCFRNSSVKTGALNPGNSSSSSLSFNLPETVCLCFRPKMCSLLLWRLLKYWLQGLQ